MATRTVRGLSLLTAALMGTTALSVAGPVQAQSKVGVTSATDGDPLGKPPATAERVLRIGIDVQANEVVTTHGDDRAHLVFLDGSSLTVGPNARLTIDKFVYDPASKTGELAITASQGVLRFVGGKISKTNPVTINTPSGTIGIRGGIGIFGVNGRGTTANFLFGKDMTVTGQGQTQTVTRPGFQVIVNNGAPPGLPTLLPPGGVSALITQLETGNSNKSGGSGTGDQKAQSSGFSSNNSGQTQNPGGVPPGGLPPNTSNNVLANTVSNTNPATNPDPNNPPGTPVSTSTTPPPSNDAPPPPPPPPPPPTQTTQTLKGYVGGLIVASTGGGEHHHRSVTAALSGARPGDLTIKTDAENSTATAKIIIRGMDGSYSSPNATLSLGTGSHGVSFFQDDQNYITATVDGHAKIRAGETTIRARDTSVLLTASQVPGGSYVGTGCTTCSFLTFGEWETVITPEGRHGHHHGHNASAVVTQAPWVAGTLATQLPNTQSASFAGGMWGQAQNAGGSIRNVTGSFGLNYSWGAGSGAWNANFDNRAYSGTVTGAGASFGASAIPGTGSAAMGVSGSFMTGPGAGGSVVGVAGQFSAGATGYKASGVFGGGKVP
jgi:FecR-like protein